jgi:hypothetical protein
MNIVAIHQLQGHTEELAHNLAQAMGITPYEARTRVSVPSGGPTIVASFASRQQAEECALRLSDTGFSTLVLDSEHVESDLKRLIGRKLQFEPDALEIACPDGQRLSLPYEEINLILRGTGIISAVELETSTKKKFALGRAVATGGLVMRKKVKNVTTTTNQERQPFCHLYVRGQQPVVLRQAEMDYSTLGENRQLSRDANFNWICAELRRRCPSARWDERLQTRPGLAQTLGPAFDPEQHVDVAITLVAQAKLFNA